MIYNVSAMMTENDNGICWSFETEAEAIRCVEELKKAGAYHWRRWNGARNL